MKDEGLCRVCQLRDGPYVRGAYGYMCAECAERERDDKESARMIRSAWGFEWKAGRYAQWLVDTSACAGCGAVVVALHVVPFKTQEQVRAQTSNDTDAYKLYKLNLRVLCEKCHRLNCPELKSMRKSGLYLGKRRYRPSMVKHFPPIGEMPE